LPGYIAGNKKKTQIMKESEYRKRKNLELHDPEEFKFRNRGERERRVVGHEE
jgi:hypothetical protein